ncbi:omptin family outer membrane protease [Vibrio tetraodonis]|uniref:omptin family outer membrane protease n=1 Tax=Vibrio tetraodonis TaxID=2231647 RepID=UPI0013B3AEE4|nr:omptin family outer membrane protease [Vibrio tetraodonis]
MVKKLAPLLLSFFFAFGTIAATQQGTLTFESSLGLLNGSSTELVYQNSGQKLSQLDWEIESVPTVNFSASWSASERWILAAQLWSVLTSDGDAHMEDRDWLVANQDSPSHISIHPDTKLRHAFEIDLSSTYWLVQRGYFSLGLLGGYQYNEFKWDGIGGTYSYNNGADVGSFADIVVIDYKQQFSVWYMGLTGEYQLSSRSSLNSTIKWSPFAYAKDVDNHYLRNLRFYDDGNDFSNFLSLSLNYSFSLLPQTYIFTEYVYTKYFESRADITQVNTDTGATSFSPNAGGLDNDHSIISIGLKYMF